MIFLDTHVVAWLYAKLLNKISDTAVRQIEDNDVLISQMVRLELQYLFEIQRITATPEEIISTLSVAIGLKVSPMKVAPVFDQAITQTWTRDVFDRLIVAEADVANAILVTKDKTILAYYGKAVW